jgi:hypothetical protein
MWRSKKFIIITALVVVAVAGTIGGVALAQGNGDENTQPGANQAALLERVCEIYQENTGVTINADDLQAALTQAQGEIRDAALQSYLQGLVDSNKLTQEQADALLKWWQERPDVPGVAGFAGQGMHRGFCGPGGFGGWFGPAQPTQPAQ